YPEGARTRLWEGAELFASNGSYREAIALGRRALENDDPSRGEERLKLAHWQICLGELAPAQRALAELAHTPAELLERPTFIALREAWLLLPEADRKPFADRLEHDLDKSPSPVHAA